MKNKKFPEGYFVGIGTALGALLGIPLAISIGNPGLLGIGIPIGLAIGLALEEKYKKEERIRPLTENEKKNRKIILIAGIGFLIIGIILFIMFLLK